MRIAVLGGGHGCWAAVAELAEHGHEVRWWRRDAQAHQAVRSAGALTIRDHRGTRQVPVGDTLQPVTDLAEAVREAELVVIPLPSTTHQDLAARLAPLLTDGQVVFLPPGTLGSVLFAKAMADAGNAAEVAFAETGTLPYLARKHGSTEVVVSGYATRLPTGVFPSRLADNAFRVLREAYPSVETAEDGLSGALMNAGPIIHPPLILMNAGPLEHFEAWDIHNEGTQPSIRRVTDALDAERIALREALGYRAPHFPLADHYATDGEEWMYGRAAHEKLTDSGDWREKIDLLDHRYMLEDTRLGLSLLVSVGRWAGVPTPVALGLLSLASAVTGRDLYAEGRTLEALGLAELSRYELAQLLREGFKS
ncbi:NAD/NADP octopine/nopaline dehydrogenase family protein [Saccharopolyspora sp. NPDC000359]|uniref:NAD/NADP-dependent octopine/nopaline dehydrogenase family protein n=1 Tax=Saccharopolyspora sp. NPDC000359 TaxID=3154251 RepID=UPI00332BE95C